MWGIEQDRKREKGGAGASFSFQFIFTWIFCAKQRRTTNFAIAMLPILLSRIAQKNPPMNKHECRRSDWERERESERKEKVNGWNKDKERTIEKSENRTENSFDGKLHLQNSDCNLKCIHSAQRKRRFLKSDTVHSLKLFILSVTKLELFPLFLKP